MLALLNGISLSMGLIVSIGPQNLELIRAGLLNDRACLLASIFILCDICLIIFGVLGVARLMSLEPWIGRAISCAATVILLYLAYHAFKRMKNPMLTMNRDADFPAVSTSSIIKKGLVLSFFNPLAILETVIIIGSTASQYHSTEKLLFTIGTICTSVVWFYSVSFGAQRFSYLLAKPESLKILEGAIGIILVSIAFKTGSSII